MSAQNAKDAADDIVARLAAQLAGAKGRKFQLVTFESDEDCRFFYPRRSVEWQRQTNTYVSRALRERFSVRVQRISLTPPDYVTYRQRMKIEDDPKVRRTWADSFLKLME